MTQVAIKTPEPVAFSKNALKKVERICSRYPKEQRQSAVIPVLWVAQQEFGGWLSVPAMELVAETLNMPYIRVYEVATFYTMFNLKPVGKHHVQVCTNCACLIRGSDKIVAAVKEVTGISQNKGMSEDGQFTFEEVECLGACVDAPMMQVTSVGHSNYFTNLTAESTKDILEQLRAGKSIVPDTPTADIEPVTTNPSKGGAKR